MANGPEFLFYLQYTIFTIYRSPFDLNPYIAIAFAFSSSLSSICQLITKLKGIIVLMLHRSRIKPLAFYASKWHYILLHVLRVMRYITSHIATQLGTIFKLDYVKQVYYTAITAWSRSSDKDVINVALIPLASRHHSHTIHDTHTHTQPLCAFKTKFRRHRTRHT